MRAVILAGGKGTRLRPYTTVLPKPLVPVGDRPILEIVIRQLARHGFTRIDLSVGHLGSLIKAYLDTIELPDGLTLEYWWEQAPLGTAGALTAIDVGDEPFLAMNGDILTTLDYAQLMRFHQGHEGELTIATHQQDVNLELGVITSEDGFISDYLEKPTMKFEVSMGVYIYDRSALELIPPRHFDFPDVVHALLSSTARWPPTRRSVSGSTSGPRTSTSVPPLRSRLIRSSSAMTERRVPLADVITCDPTR